MKDWMNDNLWKILTAVAVGLMAWAVLDSDVDRMKPAIVKNAAAIEVVEDDITALEKADIGIQGSVEALKVQQEAYHKDSDEKLDAILRAVEK